MENTADAYDIDDLKGKNPGKELAVFSNDQFGVEWIFKLMTSGEYQAYRAAAAAAGDDLVPVIKSFVVGQIVWPSPAEVKEKLGKLPGLIEPAIKAILKSAGVSAEFSVKKL